MATLSVDQIAQDMRNAGFPENTIPVGTAIALAESGGRTDAVNNNDPYGGSWGLWQINGAHFSGETNVGCALDPQCATNFAFQLSSGGQNWTAWGAFTDGRYQQYLNENVPTNGGNQFSTTLSTGKTPSNCGPGGKCVSCPQGYHPSTSRVGLPNCAKDSFPFNSLPCPDCQTPDPIKAIGDFFTAIQDLTVWLSDPIRIIKLVAGLLLIGGAILLLINPTAGLAGELAKAMKQAIPNPKASFKKGAK